MRIARIKRKENIAEYILYLWQLEDLLRALQFSPEAIHEKLVAPQKLSPEEAQQVLVWYIEIGSLLKGEGKEKTGHLEHTLHLLRDLQSFHDILLVHPQSEKYRKALTLLAPDIPSLKEKLATEERPAELISDIEIMFRALYAAMLYRMKGGEQPSPVVNDVVQLISPVVALLADYYRRAEQGEFDTDPSRDE